MSKEKIMNLSKVYIENFRSIKEVNLSVSNYSVIFGENNEGKSNIMKAIHREESIINDFSTYCSRIIHTMRGGLNVVVFFHQI